MEYIKLQIGCLAIVFFLIFIYLREVGVDSKKRSYSLFSAIYICAIVWIIFDGATSYTVNHLESVNYTVNLVFHMCFYVSIDTMVFLMFLYLLSITEGFPPKIIHWVVICAPLAINLVILFSTINSIEFIQSEISNYSVGGPASTCYSIVVLYFVLTFITFFRRWKYIEKRKCMTIFVYMSVSVVVLVAQYCFPEILITSIVPVIFVLGIYLNHEEPAVKKLQAYNHDTVVDFATLVENRDNNTGGHIKRTTAYVSLLVNALRTRGYHSDLLTKDFINNLKMAAPMHDIGKISTPDAILQKPGKLTDEEYDIMKQHAAKGSEIIKETFGKRGDSDFIDMAYDVARFHHEKWNGRGYPAGLKDTEIPLAARIMAVADVFDAVSQKRCYREAMPLDECFKIIEKGRGSDFDPVLVDIFLEEREKVEEVYKQI